MRKLIYLVAGSLCMSAAMTSCVDDEESNEVKEMRQVQLNQMKLDLEQFVLVSQQEIIGDKGVKLNIDYTRFRLKHILSLYPLVFEDFDASSEIDIIKEYGTNNL